MMDLLPLMHVYFICVSVAQMVLLVKTLQTLKRLWKVTRNVFRLGEQIARYQVTGVPPSDPL